jgi:hypothetical protein
VLCREGFDQIVDPVGHFSSALLQFLSCRIAPVKALREHPLSSRPSVMQGESSIWSDGVLAQPRCSTANPVERDEDPAAFWSHLDSETGKGCVPVDFVLCGRLEGIDRALGQFDFRHLSITCVPHR